MLKDKKIIENQEHDFNMILEIDKLRINYDENNNKK